MNMYIVLALSIFSNFAETTKIMSYPSKDLALLAEESMDGRIINGYLNKPGEIPYIVSLGNFSAEHNCGGVIIDHDWILTAAHCLENVSVLPISYGAINWEEPLIRHYVEEKDFFIHKNYSRIEEKGFLNNIALIKTPYVEFNEYIKNISLPNETDQNYANKWARASGWGYTFAENHTNFLRTIDLKVGRNSDCTRKEDNFILSSTHMCTQGSTKSTCAFDFGGPLVLNANETLKETPILIGITSSYYRCCLPEYPNIFTRVSEFLEWIDDTIKSN